MSWSPGFEPRRRLRPVPRPTPRSPLRDHEAGDRLEDAVDLLDLLDYQLTDRVDVGGLADGDHVVLTGYGVRSRDAALPLHLPRDLDGPAGRGVDQNICLHARTPNGLLDGQMALQNRLARLQRAHH